MESVDDLNVFMMCTQLDEAAFSEMPAGYSVRSMQPDEFEVWKGFPFDSPAEAVEYEGFMENFFTSAYSCDPLGFISSTLFACDPTGLPVATCGVWSAYGEFTTMQWFKTIKACEGQGLGRALLSVLLRSLEKSDFPLYLHTQAGSFRAIKLYSDFGFQIIENELEGLRPNQYVAAMDHLRNVMPGRDFARLQTTRAPLHFEKVVAAADTIEF